MNLFIGNQPDPKDRRIIEVSDETFRRIRSLKKPFTVDVYDEISKHRLLLADEDCGAGCRCALRIVLEEETSETL